MIYIIIVYSASFIIFSSYSGVIRHTTLHDSIKIFLSISLSAAIIALVTYFVQTHFKNHVLNIPFSVILIHYLLCAFFLINSRFFIKLLYVYLSNNTKDSINVLIYGAGNLGLITKNALHSDHYNNYRVMGFIEDNPSKQGKIIEGIKTYPSGQVFNKAFLEKENIKEVIIAIQGISITQKRKIANTCLNHNLKVKNIP
ncbi:MAG: nucleoside-diphosphate sugar epimerase/dehydratase, partial [bacterium]